MSAEASSSTSTIVAPASPSAAPGAKSVHLLVIIHGMWGNPIHLEEARRIMHETRCEPSDPESAASRGPGGERLHLLVAETNRDDSTYDGIDWGGERVAEEVRAVTLFRAPRVDRRAVGSDDASCAV